jgi:hypothetical protein
MEVVIVRERMLVTWVILDGGVGARAFCDACR